MCGAFNHRQWRLLARIQAAMSTSLRARVQLPFLSPTRFSKYMHIYRYMYMHNPVLGHFAQVTAPAFSSSASLLKRQLIMSKVAPPNSSLFNQELFSYTSGRYLYNEKLRLAERYVPFNIEALKKVTAHSVNREKVIQIKKLAEGGFNRVLLLTMDDGMEVIVKIPYSIAVPKSLATESEVATLDFLRCKGIPVPRVYAWSSQAEAEENEVGTEYIIMEKAAGSPLEDRWFNLTDKEQIRLVTSYAEIERKLFSFPFGYYGSIYYKDSLPRNLQADLYAAGAEDKDGDAHRFCIGPTADYMFWRGKRAQLEINRGPCELFFMVPEA